MGDTGAVPEFCTCGAQLPPDALFCHKCGRPQREIASAEALELRAAMPDPVLEPPQPATPPGPPPINFHNRIAVRGALLSAGVAWLVMALPMPPFVSALWMLIWMVAAGFVSVWLYHRRTGEFLSVRRGARVGWLTGIFCFLIGFILFATSIAAMSQEGGLAAAYRQQATSRGNLGPEMEEALRMLDTPAGLAVMMGFAVVFLFLMLTGLPMLGGVLGAKVLEKE